MTKPKQSWPVSPKMKRWARTEMERQGLTQDELGAKAGCTGAAISMLLNVDRRKPIGRSEFWGAIVEALGGTPPRMSEPDDHIVDDSDEHRKIVLEHWPELEVEDRAVLSDLARRLTKKR